MNLKDQLVQAIAGQIFIAGGSQAAMAGRLGIRQADVSLLKNKAARMSLDKLLGIAEKLGVKVTHSIEIGDVPEVAAEVVEDGATLLGEGFKF